MKTIFSGEWRFENTALVAALNKLSHVAQSEFDIEISIEKMLAEEHYRQLVLSELFQLGHKEINEVINWLNPIENITVPKQDKKKRSKVAITSISVILMISALFAFLGVFNTEQLSAAANISQVNIAPENTGQTNALKTLPTIKPEDNISATNNKTSAALLNKIAASSPKLAFRLHGSNTIGEKLAPKLLEGFLQQQGINEFTWLVGSNPLERRLTYQANNQEYAIELHAHGSSTAFSDLKANKADIGMASRRIKLNEVKQLQQDLGDLNKVGNEHIIGLDGLAVIVNQNNPIKQISSDALAEIFAGDITNWPQVGGPSLPIKRYARDGH